MAGLTVPSKPPNLRGRARSRRFNAIDRPSAEQRGYGAEHRAIRKQLLIDEPLCRKCREDGRTEPAVIADHIIPLAEGGKTVRSNYQPLCRPCSDAKTAAEAQRARRYGR